MAKRMKKTTTSKQKVRYSVTAQTAHALNDVRGALKGDPYAALRALGGPSSPPVKKIKGLTVAKPKNTVSRGRGGRGGGASGVSWATAGPRKTIIRTINGRKVPLGGNR